MRSSTRIAQQVGGSCGAAVFAIVLQHQLSAHGSATGQAVAFGHTLYLGARVFFTRPYSRVFPFC